VTFAHSPYSWQPVDRHRMNDRMPRKSSGRRFGARFTAALALLVGLGILLGTVFGHVNPAVRCGAACPRPPVTAGALPAPTVYQADAGWTVEYDPAGALKVDQSSGSRITFTLSGYPVAFRGDPADGRSAQQIAEGLAQSTVPQGQFVYAIPNAELGFVKGYGAVYDAYVQAAGGETQHVRYIVMTSIRNGLAVSVQAIGPFQASGERDGHPNPAGTPIAAVLADPANTVTWPSA